VLSKPIHARRPAALSLPPSASAGKPVRDTAANGRRELFHARSGLRNKSPDSDPENAADIHPAAAPYYPGNSLSFRLFVSGAI
jgi:hypothetical protein